MLVCRLSSRNSLISSIMEKLLAGTPKHLALTQPLGVAPCDYLLLNISARCNYRCRKCCNAKGTADHRRVTLTLEEIKKIIRQARVELGIRAIVFAGEGETLLAPHFKEIIRFSNQSGLASIVFTNAYFLDENMARFLLNHDVSLVISCDSVRKQAYEYLTRAPGSFNQAMENINAAAKIYGSARRIARFKNKRYEITRLGINSIVSDINRREVNQIQRFCRQRQIMSILNFPLIKGHLLKFKSKFLRNKTSLAEQMRLVFRKSENRGFTGICDGRCGYLFHGFSIGIDGSILAPCAYCPENEGAMGNIREYLGQPGGFIRAHDKVKKTILDFAKKNRVTFCLPRHPKYHEYLKLIGLGKKKESATKVKFRKIPMSKP